jgi:hypothetical protein
LGDVIEHIVVFFLPLNFVFIGKLKHLLGFFLTLT